MHAHLIFRRYCLGWGVALSLCLPPALTYAADSPMQFVREFREELIQLNKLCQQGMDIRNRQKDIFRTRISEKNFLRGVLGNWRNEISSAQREKFTQLFFNGMLPIRFRSIWGQDEDDVEFLGERRRTHERKGKETNYSEVRASVASNDSEGRTFPIAFRLKEMEGQWKIYDLILDPDSEFFNESINLSWRVNFFRILRERPFDYLLEKLEEKNEVLLKCPRDVHS